MPDNVELPSSNDEEKPFDRVILNDLVASVEEIASLPLGFQKIYFRSLVGTDAADSLLVHNAKYGSVETAKGSSKPISKIVDLDMQRSEI